MSGARTVATVLVTAALLPWPTQAEAKLVLRQVVLHGVRKTKVSAVQARIQMQEGDRITLARIEGARKRLEASGLFREVDVWLDMRRAEMVRLMYLDAREHPADLHITLEEKQSWFAFPIASAGGGQATGGLVYFDRNLAGRGIEIAGAGQHGTTKTDAQLAVRDPILGFAPLTYALSGLYRLERLRFYEDHRKVLEVPTEVAGGAAQLGYSFFPNTRLLLHALYRWQDLDAPELPGERGELDDVECMGGGLVDASGQPVRVEPAYNCADGHIVRLGLSLGYDSTSAPEGLRRGARVQFRGDVSDRFWKSDFDYARLEVLLGLYGYLWRTYPSAVLRAALVYPTSERGVPVIETLRAGGSDLRGYQVDEFHGDTLVAMQLEEQVPLLRLRRPWRLNFVGAVFADVAALLERHPGGRIETDPARRIPSRPDLEDFHTSVGAGVRLLIPGVAIPAIRVDLGYGIDVRDYAVSFSLGMQ